MAELTVGVSTWALVAMGAVLLAAEAFAYVSIPRALVLAPFILVLIDALVGIASSAGVGVVGLIALWRRRGQPP